jgi:hypothetical protein
MDPVLKIITEKMRGGNGGALPVFVFPSESAASLWAAQTLSRLYECAEKDAAYGEGGLSVTIPGNNFIAWDQFKEKITCGGEKGRAAANRAARLLFARYIINENINAEKHFLSYLIPDIYARDGKIFTTIITQMLPSLKLWDAKAAAVRRSIDENIFGNEYKFLQELQKRYTEFLDKTNLFEPSWEKPRFRDAGNEYYIFYPSLIADFCEYEELLAEGVCEGAIHIIPISKEDEGGGLSLYDTTREELRALASRIRRLYYEEHIPYEDIFVSVPELETLEPYIKREFNVYNIPFHLRSGKPLAEYAEGRLFAQIQDCIENNFSFEASRSLLFNYALPWKTRNKNFALVRFGIKNNCVQGRMENGSYTDVWEEAFRHGEKNPRLFSHYMKIKKYAKAFLEAKDFNELETALRKFIKRFFHKNENPVIGRISQVLTFTRSFVNEITALYPCAAPDSPLELFIAILKEETHVRDEKKSGVQIFKYGVAASAPSRAHFIINANQKSATKLYRPLGCLREDSRAALKLNDVDASKDFFRCYNSKSSACGGKKYVYFSAASLTFSGWNIPHSYFDRQNTENSISIIREKAPERDLFIEERAWWAATVARQCAESFGSGSNKALLKIQKDGFSEWQRQQGETEFNLLTSPFQKTDISAGELRSRIARLKYTDGKLRVSATSLKRFFACQTSWLFNDIFKIEEIERRAVLIDDIGKGLLYHDILKVLFARIKDGEDEGRFNKKNMEKYYLWAQEASEKITKHYPAFRGPLVRSLLEAIADSLARKIKKLLDTEGDNFDGWYVEDVEKEFSFDSGDIILHGFIDRVSLPPDKSYALIVDYKTTNAPSRSHSTEKKGAPLSDFQIAFYIKMYEKSTGRKTGRAIFFTINSTEIKKIVWEGYKWRDDDYSRDLFEPSIEALDDFIAYYATAVGNLDFSPKEATCNNEELRPQFSEKAVVPFNACIRCVYKDICRTTFSSFSSFSSMADTDYGA